MGKSSKKIRRHGNALDADQVWRMAMLFAKGATVPEIANELGITIRTVYRYKNDPELLDKLEQLQADAFYSLSQKFRAATTLAYETVVDLARNARSESVRLKACALLLECAGFKPPKPEDKETSEELRRYVDAIIGPDGRVQFLLPGGRLKIYEQERN